MGPSLNEINKSWGRRGAGDSGKDCGSPNEINKKLGEEGGRGQRQGLWIS